ncbi:MAG: Holliday junction resolvase RuvX [Phycisphaeraceae bacterium]|nr:Holliday junction resolvase RuvX [Phycisphaeraceae bacterium]
MMRYLALDLGDKRTGVAMGDAITRLVTPLRVIEAPLASENGQTLLRQIVLAAVEAFGERDPGELVMGLPLNMDGTEGPRAKLTRAFAQRIEQATGRKVHLVDERLTSVEAEWALSQRGLTHKEKKMRRDSQAAAAILRDFLSLSGREGVPEGGTDPG